MLVILEDKEDILGNFLFLVFYVKLMELGIVWLVKNIMKLI